MAAGLTQMVQRRECAIKRARGRNEKTPALRTVAGKKKGSKGGGGGQGQGQRSASDTRKTVREGQAYQQETRKNALQMHGLTKRLPDGRVLFDNLNLALFYGAKVSIVGQVCDFKLHFRRLRLKSEMHCFSNEFILPDAEWSWQVELAKVPCWY